MVKIRQIWETIYGLKITADSSMAKFIKIIDFEAYALYMPYCLKERIFHII